MGNLKTCDPERLNLPGSKLVRACVLALLMAVFFVSVGLTFATPGFAVSNVGVSSTAPSWQIAQVLPRPKPGDDPQASPDSAPRPTPKPVDEGTASQKNAGEKAGQGGGDFVWNQKDLEARNRKNKFLGVLVKLMAGVALAFAAVMAVWTLNWRTASVFLFAAAVWLLEFRSILAGFEIGMLGFLNFGHTVLALTGLMAVLMIDAALGRELPDPMRKAVRYGFGGLFFISLLGGFMAPAFFLALIRFAILIGGIAIFVIMAMAQGHGQGRSFSTGLFLVALSIFASALSPLLINTQNGSPQLLWLHVLFLIATFFIIFPARFRDGLSAGFGAGFQTPSTLFHSDPPLQNIHANQQYEDDDFEYEQRAASPGPREDDYYDDEDGYDDEAPTYSPENYSSENYSDEDDTDEGTTAGQDRQNSQPLGDEDRYALGIAGAQQGIWDWNIEYDELYLSPSVDGMLGLPAGGLVRSEVGWAERVHPEDFDNYRNTLRKWLQRGNASFDIEFRIQHQNGDYIWMQLRATCLPDDDGFAARCIGTVADVTPTMTTRERLLKSAALDPLTGLMSRGALTDRLKGLLQGSEKNTGHKTSRPGLIIIDLDRFKTVNDSLGHGVGDALLEIVARRLDTVVGSQGCVARLGSDEFAILVDGSGLSTRVLAEQVLAEIARPVELEGFEVFPMASIGLSDTQVRHAPAGAALGEAQNLFKNAETAMFKAKRSGGGCVEVYVSTMSRQSVEALSLETDLRRALERQQMEVLFQPIVELHNGAVVGFEALLRWHHPVHGLMTPGQFVAMAEQTDMIVPLGRFVLSMASHQLAQWHRVFPLDVPLFVSVNVSGRQLKRADFVDDVREALYEAQLLSGTLKLEVTETLIMEDPNLAEQILADIRAIGAGVVLDDFGTGFASLSNLQRYPFDTIKVDRSFVSTMNSRSDSSVIVNSVVSLANDLGLSVIAEGLESDNDVHRLQQMGCHYGQGYVFGAPMAAHEAQSYIARHWNDNRG